MYLTTPIYYVNDVPHLGHAYTTVLADALVRWERLCGRPARLVTGTDEHGLKVLRAAVAAGVPPGTLADTTSARFRSAWASLDIGFDDFVRTTSARHRAVVSSLLQSVYDNGFVELGTYDGRYCVGCEAYVAEAVCGVHRQPTEHVTEENYFFRLSALAPAVASWLGASPSPVVPATRRNEAIAWLRAGLTDFSISRTSLDWGIPLPWDRKHVAYVWFDALGAYLTGAATGLTGAATGLAGAATGLAGAATGLAGAAAAGSGRWWPAHHLIGKDILRFHALYWPAILIAAGLAPPERVIVHGFLLARGEKIAKSGLSSVPLDELVAAYGADGVRYHLLRSYPVGPDGEFTVAALTARYNADLANTLGNLVSRVASLVASTCGGVGPAPATDSPLAAVVDAACADAGAAWDSGQPAAALTALWRLVAATNSHLVAAEPWRRPAGADRVLGDALEALRLGAIYASPAIPGAAAEIWRRLGLLGGPELNPAWGGYPGGAQVLAGAPPLFPRVR